MFSYVNFVVYESKMILCCIYKSKDRKYNNKMKRDKMTMINKTLHKKLKIDQHEPY